MLPEERAREKIDRQLKKAGWDIVPREEYIVAKLEELLPLCEKGQS